MSFSCSIAGPTKKLIEPGHQLCENLESKGFSKSQIIIPKSQIGCYIFNGFENIRVGAAAANVSAHEFLDVGVGFGVAFFEQTDGGAYLAGGAVATLEGIVFNESFLHGVEGIAFCQTFYRSYLCALAHGGQVQTAIDASAIYQHGAGTTLATVAALFGTGELQVFPQGIEQRSAGVYLQRLLFAVDGQAYRGGHSRF